MYSHSAVHRKNRDLNQSFMIVVKSIIDETKIISPTVNITKAMTVRWYWWQETILRDVYDSISCCNPFVLSKFRNLRIDQEIFVTQYKLLECDPNIARTNSEKIFLFLYKYLFYIIPFYFFVKDIVRFFKK